MKIFKISSVLLIIFLILFCNSKNILKSQKITKDGLEILYGEISKEQLFFDFPDWKNIYGSYSVNNLLIDSLTIFKNNQYEVDIFLGTWCGDSKREVPRFLKIMDHINIAMSNNVKLFAVDRKKKLNNGLAEQNNIQRVATFIIKNNSKEIGRIVESPDFSLEKDLLFILNNQ